MELYPNLYLINTILAFYLGLTNDGVSFPFHKSEFRLGIDPIWVSVSHVMTLLKPSRKRNYFHYRVDDMFSLLPNVDFFFFSFFSLLQLGIFVLQERREYDVE